jgi:ABC-type transport system involved in cytochrome bd biosynthesis fused ATPase/permease subunit
MTHNEYALQRADQVFFLQEGKIDFWGTHSELLQSRESYRNNFTVAVQ